MSTADPWMFVGRDPWFVEVLLSDMLLQRRAYFDIIIIFIVSTAMVLCLQLGKYPVSLQQQQHIYPLLTNISRSSCRVQPFVIRRTESGLQPKYYT